MAKKIQDGNQIVTNVDSNDNLTFSIKSSFIDSTPTTNSTNLVTSGGVKSALDINTTDIAAAVIRIANNETNISNNTDDIEALEDAVSTNTTNISTNTTDIDNLETTVGTLSTNVNANTTNIGTLSNLTTTNKTSVVNAVNELNAPQKWVLVGSTAPTNGERVWFAKGKNLYNNALISASLLKTRTTVTYENEQIVMRTTGADAYFGNIVSVGNSWTEPYGQLISVEPNTNYTLSITNNLVDKNFITYYDENKVSIKIDYNQPYQVTFTTPNNAKYVSFRFGTANSTSDGVYKFNIQLEKGSTATTYEPYVEPSIYVDEEEWYNSNMSKYSTNEVKIGTWIDGKPLYRKVISFTPAGNIPANTWTTLFNYTFTNLKQLIKSTVLNTDSTNTGEMNWLTVQYFSNDNAFKGLNTRNMTVTLPTNSLIIVEYTKTTD